MAILIVRLLHVKVRDDAAVLMFSKVQFKLVGAERPEINFNRLVVALVQTNCGDVQLGSFRSRRLVVLTVWEAEHELIF